MLRSHMPCVLLKFRSRIGTVAIKEEIETNGSHSLVYNSAQLVVNNSAPIKTSCTGKLCDCQTVNEMAEYKRLWMLWYVTK